MKITTVAIENFLTIGEIEARLDDRGLVLIQGANDDDTSQNSNGSGKSSFPDAISWALFGETARGATGDAVINETVGKATRVSVDVEDGGNIYRIVRHRKHPKGKNRLQLLKLEDATGEIADLTKGTDKLTQPLVDRIVGCSADVFRAAIYCGQEQMPDLPGMTDKYLKAIVEEAAGIHEVQAAHKEAGTRLSSAKRELDAHEVDFAGATGAVSSAKEMAKDLAAEIKQWRVDHKDEVSRKQTELDESQAELSGLLEATNSAREEREKLKKAKAGLQAKIEGVQSEQDTLHELTESHREAEEVVRQAMRKQDDLGRQIQIVKSQIESYLEAKDDSAKIIGEPCSECGKPYDEADVEDRIFQIAGKLKNAYQERDGMLKTHEDLDAEIDKAKDAARAADKILRSHKDGMTDISESMAKIKKVDKLISERDAVIRDYELHEKAFVDDKKYLDALKASTCPAEDQLAKVRAKLAKLEDKVEQLTEHRGELQAQVAVKQSVVDVLSPAGVRAHILDTVTPFLNERTARYLSALTDGNVTAVWSTISLTTKGEARERFAIDVWSAVGAKSFKGLSGGEKRKVRLATSMALQDLVASRATKPIDLYIADEIDDALDESGLERLMGILEEKARERGTVLIISHNELGAWIRNSVTVRKSGGKSTIEGDALS